MLIDVVVVAVLVLALLAGLARGLVASAGALIGFVAGGLAAFGLVPLVNRILPAEWWRTLVVVVFALALLSIGSALGGALGARAGRGVARLRLRTLDRVLGAGFSVVVAALGLSLVAQSLAVTAMPGISAAVGSSAILRTIEDLTPRPVATTLAQLRGAMMDEGLPAIGSLLAPQTDTSIPDIDLADARLEAAARSVARISGVAYACGTSSTGSGFVVAADRVVTNAHVVAGVTTPVVEFPGGAVREARIVYFDPTDDLALLAVDGLDVAAIPVVPTLSAGSAAVVQGYPYGGPFTSTSARVTAVGPASVADVYGTGTSVRDVYALAATIRPGNSGGPLLTTGGEAAGVVFARDQADDAVGYAMTTTELAPVLAEAESLTAPVSSGSCAAR